jgi:uncharacterized protein involved in exopolysaccharide biosynthesis
MTPPLIDFSPWYEAAATAEAEHTARTFPQRPEDAAAGSRVGQALVRLHSYERLTQEARDQVAALDAASTHYRSLTRRAGASAPVADYQAVAAAQAELDRTADPEPAIEPARKRLRERERSLAQCQAALVAVWEEYEAARRRYHELRDMRADSRSRLDYLPPTRIVLRRLVGVEV